MGVDRRHIDAALAARVARGVRPLRHAPGARGAPRPASWARSPARPSAAGWWPTWPAGASPARRSGRQSGRRSPFRPDGRPKVGLYLPDARLRHPTPLPRLFPGPGAPRGALVVAAPRRRSDAAVHQRRDGAVQAHLPRAWSRATTCARSPARSASAPAASTTTSSRWATPSGTTPSSRCWATSPSATTSSATRSPSPGSS